MMCTLELETWAKRSVGVVEVGNDMDETRWRLGLDREFGGEGDGERRRRMVPERERVAVVSRYIHRTSSAQTSELGLKGQ